MSLRPLLLFALLVPTLVSCRPDATLAPPPSQAFVAVDAFPAEPGAFSFGDRLLNNAVEAMGPGVAVFDADQDGWLDVFVANGTWLEGVSHPADRPDAPFTDRLFRNRGDGTFEDATDDSGLGGTSYGMGAVVGDYDADGDQDVLVLNLGRNTLYQNEGDGTFRDVTVEAGLWNPTHLHGYPTWSLAGFFFDYDLDRDLDLFVVNHVAFVPNLAGSIAEPEADAIPGPRTFRSQRSVLYRNDRGVFRDVSIAAGIAQPGVYGRGAMAGDFDGDGYPDVYQAVDGGPDLLFHNQGDGTFQDIARVAGVLQDARDAVGGLGQPIVADVDQDGRMDVFISALDHGSLMLNRGNLLFAPAPPPTWLRTRSHGAGWGGTLADLDNDGDLDLVNVRGSMYGTESPLPDLVLLNDGAGGFTERYAPPGDFFHDARQGRGLAVGDFDNDGDLDLVVCRKDRGGAPRLVRNDLAAGRHWLQLVLVGTDGNRDATGARVELTTGGRTQVREVGRGGAAFSQHMARVHFGLGTVARVDELVVHWPGGAEESVPVAGVDRILVIEQ